MGYLMTMPTDEEKIIIKDIVLKFASVEMTVRKELDEKINQKSIAHLISMGLVNFVGNFIYQNSSSPKARSINYENFMKNLINWIDAIENHAKKH
jgi:hypothetical protein